MKNLSKLKSGDIIIIEYGDEIMKAKVILNYPLESKIYIETNYLFFNIFPSKVIKEYDSHCFKNFNLLNPQYND